MNPLLQGIKRNSDLINNRFVSRLSHISPYSMAMYFANYAAYNAEKDKQLPHRFNMFNQQYTNDAKQISDFQKYIAEKTWNLNMVKIKYNISN
jgi:hypothetical protein